MCNVPLLMTQLSVHFSSIIHIDIVNGRIFLNFLVEKLSPLLEDLPLRQNMWMQLNGAICHFSVNVRQYMNIIFPDRWIGRGGPVSWPPRLLA